MPDWEVTLGFDPLAAVEKFSQREVGWKFLPGTGLTATVLDDNLHDLVTNPIFPQMSTPLMVRDPDTFVAGEVHKYGEVWDQLTRDYKYYIKSFHCHWFCSWIYPEYPKF